MCGIFFSNITINNIDYVIQFLKLRGPDLTTVKKVNGYTFIQTLLSMTGPITEQPFINNDGTVFIIYNGEIYNFKSFGDYNSDGECLMPLYEKYGDEFVKYLDGEFAIILVDFKQNKLIFSTDIFGTRPLWAAFDDGKIGLASYRSCLDRIGLKESFQVLANKTYIYNLSSLTCITEKNVHTFDLQQYKTTFDDWNRAFTAAIRKRTAFSKCGIFIGLSAGYDSGGIACELTKQNIPFRAYCIAKGENLDIINKRSHIIKDLKICNLTDDDFRIARNHVKQNTENYIPNIDIGQEREFYNKHNNNLNITNYKELQNVINNRKKVNEMADDNGSIGCSYICSLAIKDNYKIYLSGSGADEILSDYGFCKKRIYGHSSIGGYYPDDLHQVFPWKNFYGNSQRAYLMKEEYIAGSYGIEGRYPFLDKQVVQEFLWLDNSLKNNIYKAPLDRYLTINNFPFEKNQKLGFSCGYTSISGTDRNFYSLSEEQLENFTSKKIITNGKNVIDFNNYKKKTYEFHDIIDKSKIIKSNKNLYIYPIKINHPGSKFQENCPYYLMEDNKPIGRYERNHNKIAEHGKGLYCFWTAGLLYFSTSDNSDPRKNNKIYTIDRHQ